MKERMRLKYNFGGIDVPINAIQLSIKGQIFNLPTKKGETVFDTGIKTSELVEGDKITLSSMNPEITNIINTDLSRLDFLIGLPYDSVMLNTIPVTYTLKENASTDDSMMIKLVRR